MRFLYGLLLVAAINFIVGCGESPKNSKQETDQSSMPLSEVTKLGEIPSFMSEGLSDEEKTELKKQILPHDIDDVSVAEEKFRALTEKAKAGDPVAQNHLGVMYYTGEAVSKSPSGQIMNNDPELAAGWFFRSAEQGYADAQFNLGLMYVNGEGVSQDLMHAVELFRKAAEQGHVDAQNNLGAMYFIGEGVERNVNKAIEWFEKAAAQGNEEAQANLEAIKASQK
ncbi:tetratricopeptide repeat protein [Nitrosomonas sp.]|uniref:tetratricopeptide repeat protein n=1 Tax=Nitrosomonas sp. TaxID=42353 RepID=UPI001DA10140|nr:tetratricopeptide repeat protein [Nitrosomonas sp.]MBX3617416.1 sel1 repeat family protein [Nitrosomonas sp.]